MAKTKPIGVRFDEELLNKLKNANIVDSPQKALNLYERSYIELIELKIDINNQPENKKRILSERNENTAKISPEKQKDNKTQASEFKVEKTTTETPNNTPKTLAESEIKMIQTQINDYKLELKNPPKNPTIGLRRWTQIRESNIKELENKLKNK